MVFRYVLSKCFNIGLQEKRELINVGTTLQPKEIKKDGCVSKVRTASRGNALELFYLNAGVIITAFHVTG